MDVVMEFAEMNYYKCKTEDEENAAFLDLASEPTRWNCAGLFWAERRRGLEGRQNWATLWANDDLPRSCLQIFIFGHF